MATKIFVNLPVKDLNRSVDFFSKLGYKFNQQFTDEKATCMIIGGGYICNALSGRLLQNIYQKANCRCN